MDSNGRYGAAVRGTTRRLGAWTGVSAPGRRPPERQRENAPDVGASPVASPSRPGLPATIRDVLLTGVACLVLSEVVALGLLEMLGTAHRLIILEAVGLVGLMAGLGLGVLLRNPHSPPPGSPLVPSPRQEPAYGGVRSISRAPAGRGRKQVPACRAGAPEPPALPHVGAVPADEGLPRPGLDALCRHVDAEVARHGDDGRRQPACQP